MGEKKLAPNTGVCSGVCLNRALQCQEKTISKTGEKLHEKADNKILKIPDKDEEYRRFGTRYDKQLKQKEALSAPFYVSIQANTAVLSVMFL